MLYKHPGPHPIHGSNFDYITVPDDQVKDYRKQGWHLTTGDAFDASSQKPATNPMDGHDNERALRQLTRDELEQRATVLGVPFDGQLSDTKLRKAVADKLNAPQ